jgi:hypothetical protein
MIHIIGAGWYGCAIAHRLLKRGFQVTIWEKAKEIFSGASSYNQNRLHLGYHYPRCSVTRKESRDGFIKFKQEYPGLSKTVEKNIYAVAEDSIIDFQTYLAIFQNERYKYDLEPPEMYGLKGIRGAISVKEEVIDHCAAKKYWADLQMPINLNEDLLISNGEIYSRKSGARLSNNRDLIIDCTWGECQPDNDKYFEEWFLSLIIRKKEPLSWGALTVMDGPFFSIYPYCEQNDPNLFTLTHVALCPIQGKSIKLSEIGEIRNSVLSDVCRYYPGILDLFDFVDTFVSRKLKPRSRADSRSVGYRSTGNVMNVYAGKIDAVFFAVDTVDQWVIDKIKENNVLA